MVRVEIDENQHPSLQDTQDKHNPADPSHSVANGLAANNSLFSNLTPLNVMSKRPGARDLQSPLFLPVLQVDPSPTTGARHSIPPFYHSAAAARRSSLLDFKPPSPRTLNIVPTSVEVPFSSPKAPAPSKLQQHHHKQHAHQSPFAGPENQAPTRAAPACNTSEGALPTLPPTEAPPHLQQQSAVRQLPQEASGAEAEQPPLPSCTAAAAPDDGVKGEETGSTAAAAPSAAAPPPVSAEVALIEATPQASSKGLLPQLDPQKTLHYTANHDGWQWRKYGEKIVKGSTNPRSYYKCSNQGCSAKKIVERNTEGVIFNTEYKGLHCHPAPATIKATVKCRTTKPNKTQASQAPNPLYAAQESSTPTRRDSEGGNMQFGHGSDSAAAPPTIPRGTAHDGEVLFGDWLLAMRHEHSASMWGTEEGDGAAAATPSRAINFGQRDAAQDLAVAIQNLQSPRPLMDSPSFSGLADRHTFALRHCFGGASPRHSQLQLEQALEAALSPRPLTLNLIQQQQQQHGQLHSSQQFARPSKRPRHGGHAGMGDPSRLQLSSTASDLTPHAPPHSTPLSAPQASDPVQGSQGGGNSHSTEGSDTAGASDIAASAAAAAAAAALTAPLPLSLPLPGSTAALAASLPMLLGLPCLDPQHFMPHAAAEAAAGTAAAAALAGGSGIGEPSDASTRQGGHEGMGQDSTHSPSRSQPYSQWLEGYVQQQQLLLHQSHGA